MIPAPRFLRVGGRLVTWRAVGAGPAVVLVHGSPQSSRAVAGLGEVLAAAGFCAIMPDTPGAGHSDALAKAGLSIGDLAGALGEFVDAVGLGRFSLYGTHTGAAIAAAFALLQPARVAGLVLDGVPAWTAGERAAFREAYAPPFVTVWDGSHLTWLWARMEAQSLFFPWHQQSQAAWRGVALSPAWHLHRNAMDMLDSGDAYRGIYQASLAFEAAEVLPGPVAARLMTLGSDVLRGHAGRAPLDGLPLAVFETPGELYRAVAAVFAESPGDAAPALSAPGAFWRGELAGARRARVLLHEAGASSRVFEGVVRAGGPVVAFDLPGHGFDESEMPADADAVAALVRGHCERLGLADYEVSGRGFGAVIAAVLRGERAPAPPPGLAAHGAVDLAPVWDGTHLVRAWRAAWRQAIFEPWYGDVARGALGSLAAGDVHAAAVDLLRAGPAWGVANGIEAGV